MGGKGGIAAGSLVEKVHPGGDFAGGGRGGQRGRGKTQVFCFGALLTQRQRQAGLQGCQRRAFYFACIRIKHVIASYSATIAVVAIVAIATIATIVAVANEHSAVLLNDSFHLLFSGVTIFRNDLL
jgi:hypothetical protein